MAFRVTGKPLCFWGTNIRSVSECTEARSLQKTKDDVKELFEAIKLKMDTVDVQLQSVPELTQKLNDKTVQIDDLFKKTDSLLNEKTEQIQANETKVNDLFEKTEQFYEKTRVSFEKVIDDLETTKGGILGETIKLKNEIVIWSDEYAGKIESGLFIIKRKVLS